MYIVWLILYLCTDAINASIQRVRNRTEPNKYRLPQSRIYCAFQKSFCVYIYYINQFEALKMNNEKKNNQRN